MTDTPEAETEQTVPSKIIDIIQDKTEAGVSGSSTFDSLGLDSLDVVMIAMDIEEEFDVVLNDESYSTPMTVDQFISIVEAMLG